MKGRALIVDDDQAMCEMIDSDLRRRGFTTPKPPFSSWEKAAQAKNWWRMPFTITARAKTDLS